MAIGFVGFETYRVWKNGPWDLPQTPKPKTSLPEDQQTEPGQPLQIARTESIVSQNLFDPERGAGRSRDAEASSRAFQRVQGMVLLGTAILGDVRYAVLRDQMQGATPGQPAAAQGQTTMRLRLGDDIEGFKLSDIGDKRVVFTKGPSRVEVLLDYFRKDAPVQTAAPVPVPGQPGVRRQAIPTPNPNVPGGTGQVTNPGGPTPRVVPNLPRRRRLPIPRPNQSQTEDG